MTQSIFDPDGDATEHSGNRNLGPHAGSISHVPPDVVDGKVENDSSGGSDNPDLEQLADAANDRRRRESRNLIESPE